MSEPASRVSVVREFGGCADDYLELIQSQERRLMRSASSDELQLLLAITSKLTADTINAQCFEDVARKVHPLLPFNRFVLLHERAKACSGMTLVHEFTCSGSLVAEVTRRRDTSLSISNYLESYQRIETCQDAFFWCRSRGCVSCPAVGENTKAPRSGSSGCHGVAGLMFSAEEIEGNVGTLIDLHFGREELPSSYLFFVNIIVFYVHVCFCRRALRLIEPVLRPELTVKEKEVLKWVVKGKTSWEVGRILSMSERTVKFHLRNIYTKLDVANRAQAATTASRLGLV